jgi:microcompartment protein CcmK/EutM|tara:strand:+ start:458 stop:784 length:327 start_codon:yes stop_codon:yes gene_type:complete
MRVCQVIGTVVSTEHHPALGGRKILVVDDGDGGAGGVQLAVDAVGAGGGCRVLVSDSGAAGSDVTGLESPPLRSVIVGIIDQNTADQSTADQSTADQSATDGESGEAI